MNKVLKLFIPFLSALMLMMVIGCTGESDTPGAESALYPSTGLNGDNTPAGTDGTVSTKGGLFPIKSVPYADLAAIKLYIEDEAGGFKSVSNGDYVEPFMKKVAIEVSPRKDGERVYVSNGSWYTEEAHMTESGMYVCDFDFEYNKMAYLAQPLLVQVIYTSGDASKKKFVLATRMDYRAEDSMLVKPGLVISLGKNVFGGLSGAVGGLLGEGATVNAFGPANNKRGSDQGVMHLEVDGLINGDMVITDVNEGVRGVNIGFEDATVTNIPILKGLLGLLIDGKPILSLGAVAFDLGSMLGGLGGEDSEGDLLSSILGGLDIEKQLFFNAYGLPEPINQTYSVLGGGLYIAEEDTLKYTLSDEGEVDWFFPTEVEDPKTGDILPIEEKDPPADIDVARVKTAHDMGVGLSHFNLNQVLGGIAKNLVVELPAAALPIPLAIPAMEPGNSQIVKVTINPAGMNIDLAAYPDTATPARMDILDMRMEYYQNGAAMWVMSFDISLALNIGLSTDGAGGLSLDLALTPLDIPSFNNCHVMKDDMGIGMFDNSTFVALLFESLAEMTGGAPGDPFVIGLPLSSFGLIPGEGDYPGSITYDGQGNCFMNLILQDIDASGLCFISTAGSF